MKFIDINNYGIIDDCINTPKFTIYTIQKYHNNF